MLKILKNTTKLEIANIICFYVGKHTTIHTPEELKKIKKEDWDYQDYLVESCDKHKYNLYWFNKDTVKYQFNKHVINIDDDSTNIHLSLTKKNRKNTVIFQGQANDDMSINYEGLMRAFEYMNFLMFNTVDEIKTASDKYLSANLLSSYNISQPNYALVTKNIMLSETDNGKMEVRKTFWKLLDSIYPTNASIDSDDITRKYVCKILGGSLGIGVFICTHEEISQILQALFQLAPSARFIIQEYKENTGDIRVHLLSVDGINYEVLACMKRNKIDKDFRSNVSLGATTEKYELNEEQEKLVMRTASASGCRWVGVDLMACKDGSDVVIEYNSSPGVQGISQQIKDNMFDIVLDKVNEYIKKYGTYDPKKAAGENYRKCYSVYDPEVVSKLQQTWDTLSQKRQAVMKQCLDMQPGLHYISNGKSSPEEGLDCSGYVKYIFKKAIKAKLPGLCAKYFTITEKDEFMQIKGEDIKPGDIGIKNTSTMLNHCGIYAGDGKWFESAHSYGAQLTDCDKFTLFFRVNDIDEGDEQDNKEQDSEGTQIPETPHDGDFNPQEEPEGIKITGVPVSVEPPLDPALVDIALDTPSQEPEYSGGEYTGDDEPDMPAHYDDFGDDDLGIDGVEPAPLIVPTDMDNDSEKDFAIKIATDKI